LQRRPYRDAQGGPAGGGAAARRKQARPDLQRFEPRHLFFNATWRICAVRHGRRHRFPLPVLKHDRPSLDFARFCPDGVGNAAGLIRRQTEICRVAILDSVTIAGPAVKSVAAESIRELSDTVRGAQPGGAHMPSFDVVSEFDSHEASNAVDQANREVDTRFDFKGTGSKYALDDNVITMTSQTDFQLQQMLDILRQKLAKRGIDIACMKEEEPEISGSEARQKVVLREGIESDLARDLVKKIKASKLKVQAAIQGEKLRVSGKKRDDLQAVISLLKGADVDLPLQYENFRD
jgi:hypothetical protein